MGEISQSVHEHFIMFFLDESLLKKKTLKHNCLPVIFFCVYNTFKHFNGEYVTDKSAT